MSDVTPKKILILGGTREAAELAESLVADGHDVITSLAGRTKEPAILAGKTRIGGFGGSDGLVNYLLEENIDLFIDATHPFAKQISQNALSASKLSGVPLEIRTRMPWQKQPGDQWLEVKSLEEAMNVIPSGARVLLALGSQHIDIFASRSDVFYLVRMVDKPERKPALPHHELLIGTPSSDWQKERDMLTQNMISHILCRNSGGKGAYAKIAAARAMKLPVIMVSQ